MSYPARAEGLVNSTIRLFSVISRTFGDAVSVFYSPSLIKCFWWNTNLCKNSNLDTQQTKFHATFSCSFTFLVWRATWLTQIYLLHKGKIQFKSTLLEKFQSSVIYPHKGALYIYIYIYKIDVDMNNTKRNIVVKLHTISKEEFLSCFDQWKICRNKFVAKGFILKKINV